MFCCAIPSSEYIESFEIHGRKVNQKFGKRASSYDSKKMSGQCLVFLRDGSMHFVMDVYQSVLRECER